MRCLTDSHPDVQITVLQHTYQAQQYWIDHAEEDLLVAVYLCRRKIGYPPRSTICYLLHQSIEKWLKAFLEINGIEFGKTHNLFILLKKAGEKDDFFIQLLRNLDSNAHIILGENFSSDNLRYGKEQLPNTEELVSILFPVTFKIRRIVKKRILEEARPDER